MKFTCALFVALLALSLQTTDAQNTCPASGCPGGCCCAITTAGQTVSTCSTQAVCDAAAVGGATSTCSGGSGGPGVTLPGGVTQPTITTATCNAPTDEICNLIPDVAADAGGGRCCCETTVAVVGMTRTCITRQACDATSGTCVGAAAGLSAPFALISALAAVATVMLRA